MIPDSVKNVIEAMSQIVNQHVRATEKNVTEWCKKDECWEGLKQKVFEIPANISDQYISSNNDRKYKSQLSSEAEAVDFCTAIGFQPWYDLSKWLKERDFLTPKARSQAFNMARSIQRKKQPSVALSVPCMKNWKEAEIRGWSIKTEEVVSKD